MVVSIEKIRNEIRTIWRRKMPGHDLIRGSLNLDSYQMLLLNGYLDLYSNAWPIVGVLILLLRLRLPPP